MILFFSNRTEEKKSFRVKVSFLSRGLHRRFADEAKDEAKDFKESKERKSLMDFKDFKEKQVHKVFKVYKEHLVLKVS